MLHQATQSDGEGAGKVEPSLGGRDVVPGGSPHQRRPHPGLLFLRASLHTLLQHITFNEYLPMVLGKRNLHRHGENMLQYVTTAKVYLRHQLFT